MYIIMLYIYIYKLIVIVYNLHHILWLEHGYRTSKTWTKISRSQDHSSKCTPIAGWFVSWKILRMKMDDLGVPPICANPAMGSLPSPWKMEPIFNLPLPAVAAQLPFQGSLFRT